MSAFLQAFKKQFSSQKNGYYAQVEALTVVKKDTESVRPFALKVEQLVEKGWCNENASTFSLKCNENFTKGLPRNPNNFANKRQAQHTSTVLEPPLPSHTLVKLVDAEDIANDKIRTQDLTLEVNCITNQLQSQNLDTQQSEQLMFTQPRDHKITNTNLQIKNIAHIVIKHITPSQLVSKSIEMMKTKETHEIDLNHLHKNHLYNTFALLLMKTTRTERLNLHTFLIDTVVEVHHVLVIQIGTFHHNIDIVLIL